MIPIICHSLAWEKRHSWERHNSVSMQDAGDLFFNIYVMATGKMAAFSDLSRKTAHCPSCPPPCFILHSPLAHNLMYFLFSNINLLVISIYSFYVYFFQYFIMFSECIIALLLTIL